MQEGMSYEYTVEVVAPIMPSSQPMTFESIPTSEEPYPTLAANTTFSPMLGMHPTFAPTLTTQTIDFIKQQVFVLYVYGEVLYGEIVDSTRSYVLNWCYIYNPNKPTPENLAFCTTHNETIIK